MDNNYLEKIMMLKVNVTKGNRKWAFVCPPLALFLTYLGFEFPGRFHLLQIVAFPLVWIGFLLIAKDEELKTRKQELFYAAGYFGFVILLSILGIFLISHFNLA